MRRYYENTFNEDYELGYEKGRRDALRELRESEEDTGNIDEIAKSFGFDKKKEILYKGKYVASYEYYPLYVIVDGDNIVIKVNPNAEDLTKNAVGDRSKGSISPSALKNYADVFNKVSQFVNKVNKL